MSDKVYLGRNVASFQDSPPFAPYSKVILRYDEDDSAFAAGDDTGRALEAFCPWATQAMADNILAKVKGYAYRPFEAAGAQLDPAAELGDGVTVNGTYSVLASLDTIFDAAMVSEIGAPAEEEIDHEYPYLSPTQRELGRRVKLGASYYGTRITRKNGLEIVKTDGQTEKSRVTLNSDLLAFYNDDGSEALYFDTNAGKFRFRGDVSITGGTMNINDNFIVDENGNLSINGNIDLSGGSITWGGNRPSSGISSAQCRTIINSELVSSPNIAGGKFWDLAQEVRIEMGSMSNSSGDFGYLDLLVDAYDPYDPIFQIYCRTQGTATRGVALRASGKDFIAIDGRYDIVTPMMTWDFSGADVTGLHLTFS